MIFHARPAAAQAHPASARADRIIARCRELARISDVPGETTRTFLSPGARVAQQTLRMWMEAAGLTVWTDAIGNLRGLLPAADANAPRLLIGSHIDTVPNAGAFDGVLGVILGLGVIERLREDNPAAGLSVAIELIAFSEEEGVRFAKPFLGSLALIGELDRSAMDLVDGSGITVAEAVAEYGLDPGDLAAATADPSAAAYLEFHIEQGPVLESEGLPVAVVENIVGQSRLALTFTGHSNHAGTTPMGALRRDALAAAAEWVVEVERYGGATAGLVATVGRLDVTRGAGNIIPAQVVATLDVRHASDAVRRVAVEHLLESAVAAGRARAVDVVPRTTLDQSAVPMDPRLTALLQQAAEAATGGPVRRLDSGAGHDAMIVARKIPSAMLFLRSPAGLSHHPDESVLPEDVEVALAVGLEFARRIPGLLVAGKSAEGT